jgi:hypothetical protein
MLPKTTNNNENHAPPITRNNNDNHALLKQQIIVIIMLPKTTNFRGACLSLLFVVLESMIISNICCFREHDYHYYLLF